jgi:MFS family permease
MEATSGQDSSPNNRKWLVLSAVSVGAFISTLSGSIVNISLPTIAEDLGVGISDIEWIVVAYLLTAGSLLLTFGRLGDIVGYKKVYIGGFALFTVASVLCGLAQGAGELTVLRVLQGIGFAMIQALAPAITTAVFPPNERGRALGLTAVSISMGLTVGPTLGVSSHSGRRGDGSSSSTCPSGYSASYGAGGCCPLDSATRSSGSTFLEQS